MKKRGPAQGPGVRVVGLTGGIGAGKSEVLRLLARRGARVLQTDELGHRLLDRPDLRKKLVRRFGTGILGAQGKVDRRELGALAFRDRGERLALNRILHPAVRREVRAWVLRRKRTPGLSVVEIPLLFEGGPGAYPYFDGILSVSAPKKVRHARLKRRGWDLREIRRREKGQWGQGEKDRRAHWVIVNAGDRAALSREVGRWMRDIFEGPNGPKRQERR